MQVITRRQWPWIASSEIMFVNYFWCKGFGRNHHTNVYEWINLQRKQCMKEAIIIAALKCFICTAQNSPRTTSIMKKNSVDRISACDDNTPFPLSYSRFFRRSLFSASVMIRLRSRFETPIRDVGPTSPVSSVICCGFPLEVHLTLLQVGFQLVFVTFPLSASFPLPRWKLGVQ